MPRVDGSVLPELIGMTVDEVRKFTAGAELRVVDLDRSGWYFPDYRSDRYTIFVKGELVTKAEIS